MRLGAAVRLALVSAGAIAALGSSGGGANLDPPISGTAPPHRDIVSPNLMNRFRHDNATVNNLPPEQVAREARAVEIFLNNPIVLSSFNPFVVDDDITVTDSRFPGQERRILDYLEPGLPGAADAAFAFGRSAFARPNNEGDCEPGSSDRTCDTIVLYLEEGAVVSGTTIQFNVHGAGLEGYLIVDGAPTDETFTLGGQSSFHFDVANETGAAPELQQYSLRLPGDSGPDIAGEFEVGVCTTCPPPSTIFPLPQFEFYAPPSSTMRGIFNEPPARLGVFAEIGDQAFFLDESSFVDGDGGPFDLGVDREFELRTSNEIGQRIDTVAITSDDLLVQIGTPARFALPPATQSASGREFVQRVGTTGQMPSSDIQHLTIAHVELRDGLTRGQTIGVTEPISVELAVVEDLENDRRTVADVRVYAWPNGNHEAEVELQSSLTHLSPGVVSVEFAPANLETGPARLVFRGFNNESGALGSDRVNVLVDATAPKLEKAGAKDNRKGDGLGNRTCFVSDQPLSAVLMTITPPGTTITVNLENYPPVQFPGGFLYCFDEIHLPPGTDDGPYTITFVGIDQNGNPGETITFTIVPPEQEVLERCGRWSE